MYYRGSAQNDDGVVSDVYCEAIRITPLFLLGGTNDIMQPSEERCDFVSAPARKARLGW
jgi:hypothetical protein